MNAIVKHEAAQELQPYEPKDANSAMQMAKVLVASRLLPKGIDTPEAAFTIIVTGRELGLTVMQSIRSVHIINGKPTLSADLILGLAKRSQACEYFQLVESTDKIATYRTKRRDEPEATTMSFTLDMAKRAGITGNPTWGKYPEAMLRARCIAALARAVYPDVVLGIYETSELEPEEPKRQRVETYVAPASSGDIETQLRDSVDHAKNLKSASSPGELAEAWSRIPANERKAFAAVKDARKAEFAATVDGAA